MGGARNHTVLSGKAFRIEETGDNKHPEVEYVVQTYCSSL